MEYTCRSRPTSFRSGRSRSAKAGSAASTLWRLALLFMGVALVQQVASVVATYLSENVGWTATNGLRADLGEHCIYLDMSFHNARTPGEMNAADVSSLRSVGFSDADVLHIAEIVGYYAYANRVADGLGVELEE